MSIKLDLFKRRILRLLLESRRINSNRRRFNLLLGLIDELWGEDVFLKGVRSFNIALNSIQMLLFELLEAVICLIYREYRFIL